MSLTPPQLADIRCLAFDVFGTVVDWRSSVIREGKSLGRARGLEVDWAAFADAWRAGYAPSMNRVRQGRLSWTSLDQLHRMTLDRLLDDFGITGLSEADKANFNRAWHRLKPWPDAVGGMHRLRDAAAGVRAASHPRPDHRPELRLRGQRFSRPGRPVAEPLGSPPTTSRAFRAGIAGTRSSA